MSEEWKNASLVSNIGKWAWIIGILNGIIYIIWGLATLVPLILVPFGILGIAYPVWMTLGGIIVILISFTIIKPKFSNKCEEKDWDALYNWVLNLGSFRLPWMLVWGILFEIFGNWWGGLPILIPALILLFAGPKEYNWSTKE
ncbi:MAG: hypothetical protein ACFE85_16970 [Candidatus Hodarchaeota archaeon]